MTVIIIIIKERGVATRRIAAEVGQTCARDL
jgi:hypothetical protein